MTEISAQLVKALRDRTSAGFMECKKALLETAGDLAAAEEWLAKNGLKKVQKASGRVAAEGILIGAVSANGLRGIIIEINSETDFVARDQSFLQFCSSTAEAAIGLSHPSVEALMEATLPEGKTVETVRTELIARIGENIQVRRMEILEVTTGRVGLYVHNRRIGALAHISKGDETFAKDIAILVAAGAPQYITPEAIPAEKIAHERAIFLAQAAEEGKPQNVLEKMVEGRLKKWANEISLVSQYCIKEPDLTVADFLKRADAEVLSFKRIVLGEGIEKQQVDFATEVMSQVRRSD